jgi:hypothetical protein
MELKTYSVDNLMDWDAEIETGKAKVRVHFTGGTATAYGVTPALYTTGNPFIQTVIEHSNYFKTNRIKLLRTSGTPDVKEPKVAKPTAQAAQATPTAAAAEQSSEAAQEPASEAADEVADEPTEIDDSEVHTTPDAVEVTPTEVEVSCLTEAQVYLKENFGIASSKVRSKIAAQEYARQNGLVFVFPAAE